MAQESIEAAVRIREGAYDSENNEFVSKLGSLYPTRVMARQIANVALARCVADIVSIRHRPAAVEDRAVPGHWEGDLLSGSKNSYIATLVERHTRYVMLAKVANKDTQTVISALIKQAKKLPSELYKSLTWDRARNLRIIDDLR